MEEDIDISPGKIKRLKNLGPYKDKSDEEIIAMIKSRAQTTTQKSVQERDYQERFEDKFNTLKQEFGLDMNVSNDVEMLNNLVRQLMQSENVDRDILSVQNKTNKTKDDVGLLKALGDFQRDVQITIADLQDKLGISRKLRKEKATDDIPQWIDGVLLKAEEYYDGIVSSVMCPTCEIQLAEYWLNFPERTFLRSFTIQCPHCEQKVVYNG